MSFLPVGSLLGKSLKKAGISQQVNLALALERAQIAMDALLGPAVCEYVKPMYIQRRTLNIASLNSAAAASVGQVKDEIIEYINRDHSYPIVERIRIIS